MFKFRMFFTCLAQFQNQKEKNAFSQAQLVGLFALFLSSTVQSKNVPILDDHDCCDEGNGTLDWTKVTPQHKRLTSLFFGKLAGLYILLMEIEVFIL